MSGSERRVTLFCESGEPFQIRVEDYEPLESGHTVVFAEDGREYLFSPGAQFYIRHRSPSTDDHREGSP